MIPSAKMAIRPSPPPENRLSSPRMLLPLSRFWIELMAEALIPGAGRWTPTRYSASIAAVNSTLVRISPTLNAPRIVEIIALSSGLDQLAGSAGGFDLLTRGRAEAVGVDGERLGDLALGEHLDRDVLALGQALGVHRLQRDRVPRLEALLEIEQVDRLGVRPEGLERHRLLHVRAAQLAHPHVNRHLAALEPGPRLGARARAVALLAAAG